jgi:hypothetical protein
MFALLAALACTDAPSDSGGRVTTPQDTVITDSEPPGEQPFLEVLVRITLDGEPTAGVSVFQGGTTDRYETNASGEALVPIDMSVIGELWMLAAHPEARTGFVEIIPDEDSDLAIDLTRFDPSDNTDYGFENPGSPTDRGDTGRCAHCHKTINEAWHGSPHRTAASNVWVQDLYAGTAAALTSEQTCLAAGGSWWQGLVPGTSDTGMRCYLGHGALPDLNDDCGIVASCDGVASETGLCADCHAPAIDGQLGGRDLLEAIGLAFETGVSCDLCHKVEGIDLDASPGVGGRLRLVRPSEEPASLLLGAWQPLTFGPFDDVASIRMGGVQRDHYTNGEICAGCHQLDQPVLVPGKTADTSRWPNGTLPVHTTWQEWKAGPLADQAPCQSCHMPPDPTAGNSADLGNVIDDVEPSVVAGWYRPPGSVRTHSWVGPRTPESLLLELAASVDVSSTLANGELTVEATVRNVGPGHALPTGEPLRHLLLRVDARCEDTSLEPIGGDVLPSWAGALATQESSGDWLNWPGASSGEQIAVMRHTGDFHDYVGTGPFGDGTFDAQAKGLPVEQLVEVFTITAVDGDLVILDGPLPQGDSAYRLAADSWPADDEPAVGVAGRPGFAFAKVLADADGTPMVPHHRAVDVVSDNRLLPGESWTSTHVFEATCESPSIHAVLLYRSAPLALAQQRSWNLADQVMAEVSR